MGLGAPGVDRLPHTESGQSEDDWSTDEYAHDEGYHAHDEREGDGRAGHAVSPSGCRGPLPGGPHTLNADRMQKQGHAQPPRGDKVLTGSPPKIVHTEERH